MFRSGALKIGNLMINYCALREVSTFASEAYYGGEMFEGRELLDYDNNIIYRVKDFLKTIGSEHA
jgi:hypothetical protein